MESTTNMSIADGDRTLVYEAIRNLLNRRRQMVPWPFSLDETEQLYLPRAVWELKQNLGSGVQPTGDYTTLLFTFNKQCVRVPGILRDQAPVLTIHRAGPLLCSQKDVVWDVLPSSPSYARFREWAANAAKIQLTNELVFDTTNKAFKKMTTFRQFYKALPETFNAVIHYSDALTKARHYHSYSRAASKLRSIATELRAEGASGARNLPEEVAEAVRQHKAVIEMVMASSMLLPICDDMGNGPFRSTWWRSRITQGGEQFF